MITRKLQFVFCYYHFEYCLFVSFWVVFPWLEIGYTLFAILCRLWVFIRKTTCVLQIKHFYPSVDRKNMKRFIFIIYQKCLSQDVIFNYHDKYLPFEAINISVFSFVTTGLYKCYWAYPLLLKLFKFVFNYSMNNEWFNIFQHNITCRCN